MSETALTAAEANALSGSTDADTDAAYPGIGETPYHTTLYRLLHRLLAIVKPINQLRVYKDGDLTFGVRAGRFMDESTERVYAGSAAGALTDDATNYIYLTAVGTLTVNTSGFPDPAVTPHIPLATLLTAAGAYDLDNIVDFRSMALFTVLGG